MIAFLRKGRGPAGLVRVVANHTPAPREAYRVGVPRAGFWREELNSDAEAYGGAGWGNLGGLDAEAEAVHGRPFSLSLTLPPLGVLFLSWERAPGR